MILIKYNNKKKTKKHIIIKKRKTRLIIKKRKLRSINKSHNFIKANNFLQKYYVKSKYHLPMFHKIINKNGGGILTNLEEKEFYNNIITVAENPQNVPQNVVIIKKHIDKILEVAHNVVIKFEEEQGRDKKIKISGIDKYIREILTNIEKYKEISITALNCISLQCVILFTELLRIRDEAKFNEHQFYKSEYEKLIVLEWDNFNIVIKNYDFVYKYNKPGIVLSLLGELSLLQIIESYSKKIYICGVVIDYTYADGMLQNPIGFMYHDTVHENNRQYFGEAEKENFEAEKEFIVHIKSEYSKLNLEQERLTELYEITLLLFLIMHEETSNEYQLLKDKKTMFNVKNVFSSRLECKKPYINQWGAHMGGTRFVDINDLGGLLPDEFKNPEKTKILEEKYDYICRYLDKVCIVFNKEWNEFFKLGDK